MNAMISSAEVLLDAHGGRIRAVARLHGCSGRAHVGTGVADRSETDPSLPAAAVELATARALMDLAEQLFAGVDSTAALPTGWLHP